MRVFDCARFGDGYTMLIRTTIETNRTAIIEYVRERLPDAAVKEEHNKMIHFRVSTSIPLHRIFSILETAREQLKNMIEDYTVTQVTLDDVFVNFAKIQEDAQTSEPNPSSSNSHELLHRKKNTVGKDSPTALSVLR